MISRACDCGFELATDIVEADAIVVNTCAFILPAQAEADEAIQEALAAKEHGRCRAVVVAGCLPQYLQQRRFELYPREDACLTPDNPGTVGEVLGRLLGLS
jgi:ribosomal protein S12 methylthiotransferase